MQLRQSWVQKNPLGIVAEDDVVHHVFDARHGSADDDSEDYDYDVNGGDSLCSSEGSSTAVAAETNGAPLTSLEVRGPRDTRPEERQPQVEGSARPKRTSRFTPKESNVGWFFANWGQFPAKGFKRERIDIVLKKQPATIIGLSECDAITDAYLRQKGWKGDPQSRVNVNDPMKERDASEYLTLRGNEEHSVLIGVRAGPGTELKLLFWDRRDEAMGDNNADTDHSADESDLEGAGKDKQSAADAGDDEQPSAVPNLNQPSAVAEVIVSPEEVECVVQSRKIIAALQNAKETCQQVGAMSSVVHLDNQIRHEERKMRQRTRENPDLLIALARTMDMEAVETVARKRRVDEANANTLSSKKVHKAITEANAQLRSTRHAILDAEKVLEAKHAAKTFTIEDLGGGGGRGKKQRLELLDRMSKIGAGLAAQQRNDFEWFKKQWDTKMSEDHGDAWPVVLGGWLQQVLSDHETGTPNAFSVFVHFETVRVFHEQVALYVPGVS